MADDLLERTPTRLADLLEQRVLCKQSEAVMQCESKDEALAVAEELGARGWCAECGQALVFVRGSNEMRLVDVVEIDGRL